MKRNLMNQAHKIAKSIVAIVGDYMVAMKLALKQAWENARVKKVAMKGSEKQIAWAEKIIADGRNDWARLYSEIVNPANGYTHKHIDLPVFLGKIEEKRKNLAAELKSDDPKMHRIRRYKRTIPEMEEQAKKLVATYEYVMGDHCDAETVIDNRDIFECSPWSSITEKTNLI